MLSRASLLTGQQAKALMALSSRASSAVTAPTEKKGELWQRPVRQEPGKVRLGFVPEEWFTFFYKKTGVTGPYTLGVTVTTYLLSKEVWVWEHDFMGVLTLPALAFFVTKKYGAAIAKTVDKLVDDYEREWNESRVNEKKTLEEAISNEEKDQWSFEGQNLLVQAKRENVALQLEAAYRARLTEAYNEVKRRLDYQIEKQNVERRIAQRNLVEWVVKTVRAAITPDKEKQNIDKCITDLGALAR